MADNKVIYATYDDDTVLLNGAKELVAKAFTFVMYFRLSQSMA